MARQVVTIFGGSGFIGRHLVRRLVGEGWIIRVAVRDVESANYLKTLGDAGQVVPFPASVADPASVARAVQGADLVVNLVGILSEWGKATFKRIHAEGAANVAEAAAKAGVKRLVHVSAIGAAEDAEAKYARTKGEGEAAVRKAFPKAVILRPSVIFGPEDGFFNMFAAIARLSPVLPVIGAPALPKVTIYPKDSNSLFSLDLFGDGGAKFQPVYVGDVADAIVKGLKDKATDGKTYELGGPKVMSFKDVMDLVCKATGRKRLLMPVPFTLAEFKGLILGLLPRPLMTRDQVLMMQKPNVVADGAPGLKDLGITPTAAEAVVPNYLRQYAPQQSLPGLQP